MNRLVSWRCTACSGCDVGMHDERITCRACGPRLVRADGVWLPADERATVPEGFDHAAAERLAQLDDDDHFWVRHRRRLFERLARRLRPPGDRVLELGCGAGGMLPAWDSGSATVVAVDAYPHLLARARSRSLTATLVQADVCATPLGNDQFDLAAAFDVIEHVDPDALLAEARRVVRPGGRVLLSAPAFQSLWSAMDERAGHRCRYDVPLLKAEMARNGWRWDGHTFFQCLLFPIVLVSRRAGGGTLAVERRPGRLLDRALGAVNRLEVAVSSRVTLPFGTSLVAWGTRL